MTQLEIIHKLIELEKEKIELYQDLGKIKLGSFCTDVKLIQEELNKVHTEIHEINHKIDYYECFNESTLEYCSKDLAKEAMSQFRTVEVI